MSDRIDERPIDLPLVGPDDPSWLLTPAPPGSPTDLVRVHGGPGRLVRLQIPPILVMGSSGGSGTTTTVLGLAAAAADDNPEQSPVAVDATPTGGDLARRGCDVADPAGTVQSWLAMKHRSLPSSVIATCGETSAETGVLPRGPEPLPRRESYISVHRDLCDAGALPIYDAGGAVTNRLIAPLLADPRIGLVITLACRPDAINRLQPALVWLDDNYSQYHLADAVIVITRQHRSDGPDVADHARNYLGGFVRAIAEIPYDPHLSTGGPITWNHLTPLTRAAYRNLLSLLR
ncbi:MinD/ParA family ATP-binding protein [Nocardia jejuensis]|uniref:MinD/ParA family ATP-binding protein n=1 Tax=Nocardia jejuensis TaxID=328049 RepID=UPI00082C8364|nr:hypothetical protein [Nocardia jejuensis]